MRIRTRPASVRMRLTLWYVTTLFALLAMYATAVYTVVSTTKATELDLQLHGDYEIVAEDLYLNATGEPTWRPQQHFHPENPLESDPLVELWDTDGRLALRRGGTHTTTLRLSPPDFRTQGYASLTLNGLRLRVLQERVLVDGRPYIVRIIRSADQVHRELRSLMAWFALGVPIGLALAAAAGHVIARRAFDPVARMSEEARRISAENLAARLPIINPEDELGRLASTFNAAFERLELSFLQLRAFTADAAHELRTPLAALRGVGENALAEPRNAGVYREAISSMLEECERLTTLVNRLLLLARADQGQVAAETRSLDLGEVATQATGLLRAVAEEKGQRLIEHHLDHIAAVADPTLLLQAVLDIVDNAIRHTPPGSTIEVLTRRSGADVLIEVRDDGPGIAPADHQRIFSRFHRGDASRFHDGEGGFGLGLAVAQALVVAQRGRIEVESTPGCGAAFRILLPACVKDREVPISPVR